MKKHFVGAVLVAAGVFALLTILTQAPRAQQLTNAVPVKIVTPYKLTHSIVTLSSSATTEMTGNIAVPTASAGGIYSIMVMNTDVTNDVCCSANDTSVTCVPGTVDSHTGVPIFHQTAVTSPFNFFVWNIPVWETLSCKGSGGSPKVIVETWR